MGIHFFTGFPGFITSQIIKKLFEKNVTDLVYVLVLPTERQKAESEADVIIKKFPGRNIEIIEGNITLPNLNIEDEVVINLLPKISYFWHLAAIYDLAVPREIAWTVNVHGTSMVNKFVKQIPNLKRYMYFSTAYVAGNREGILYETELIRPQKFKNFYEETKYEAEVLVEELKVEVPTTILRPGIVRGHSKTGETVKFDGPYFFLNMIEQLKNLPFIPYIGDSRSSINVVPIDYVIDAAIFISSEPTAEGNTYHLTDPFPHPVQEVYRMMVKEMTGKFPRGRVPLLLAKKGLQCKSIRKMLGVEYETLDYLTWDASFDCTEAKKILSKGKIVCPDFISTMPAMIKFYHKKKDTPQYQIEIK